MTARLVRPCPISAHRQPTKGESRKGSRFLIQRVRPIPSGAGRPQRRQQDRCFRGARRRRNHGHRVGQFELGIALHQSDIDVFRNVCVAECGMRHRVKARPVVSAAFAHPMGVLLVPKLQFLAKILFCTEGDSGGLLVRDQDVGGSNPLAPTIDLIRYRWIAAVERFGFQPPFCSCAQDFAHRAHVACTRSFP